MADYTKTEARDWAREHMQGVCGCLLPTLTNDFQGVNEAAVRHDLRLQKEYGFWGSLLVSETGTTFDEMREVVEIAADEGSKIGLRTMLLASFDNLEQTIAMVQHAERSGVDLVLLSYPTMFYPSSEDEILEYTKTVADSTDLGIMIFAMGLWNFGRFHPSNFNPDLIGRMIDDIDNIVAVKNEIGPPGVAGIAELFRRFQDRIVVSDPWERNAAAWCSTFGMKFMGTSNYEYLGPTVPHMFNLLQEEKYDEAMEIYWRTHPARQAYVKVNSESLAGTSLVHRLLWKYQYWLNGFNGGPLRGPTARISQSQMNLLRDALKASGIEPTSSPDRDFFIGRNPA